MINRTIVRTRVIQTLFAYYKDGDKTPLTARKELLSSFADTYSLYMLLLDLINELTTYAEGQIEEAIQRSKVTHTHIEPNYRFVRNRLAQQVFQNRQLRHYVAQEKLRWDSALSSVAALYRRITESGYYQEYMNSKEDSYEADKAVWRRIINDWVYSRELESALEELEIALDHQHWTTDLSVVVSYVIKTIKRFEEANGADQELLQMFDREEELHFAQDLLRQAIEHHDEYQELIATHLRGWDPDRIAYMDRIILQTALAEIINFPDIALEVSLNEYLELAKEYSGDKSHLFINGILDEIIKEMRRNDTLLKAMTIK